MRKRIAETTSMDLHSETTAKDVVEWMFPYLDKDPLFSAYAQLLTLSWLRDETDEEMEKRLTFNAKAKVEARQHRYDRYLELKEEFEPDCITSEGAPAQDLSSQGR